MMLHFKIRLTALAIGILSLAANAQTSIGPLRHWQASIEASTYNTLDWGVELGINYRPIKYVGVKASLGLASNFISGERSFSVGNMLVKTDNVDNALWLNTGIQLQSPALWRNTDGDLQLSLKADAGISLPFPTNGKSQPTGYLCRAAKGIREKPWWNRLLLPSQTSRGVGHRPMSSVGRLHVEQHGCI